MIDTTKVHLRDLPIRRDIKVQAGDHSSELFTLEYNVLGTALVLTGVTWELTVSTDRGGTVLLSAAEIADLTGPSGVLVESAVNGQIKTWVIPTDTRTTIGIGLRWYEIALTFPNTHPQLPRQRHVFWQGDFAVFDTAVAP